MTTLTRLNSDMGDILLTNLNTPAQDCTVTMPVISGKSAYDLAVENGYVGSLQDWLASLSGWQPIDSDFANYLEQHLQLSSLFNGVNSKIEANKAELDTRIAERISEAQAISTKLENEAQERIKVANELAKQLLDEAALRVSDVSKLRDDLQSEAYERALAMDQIADDILSEQVTRVNELKDLGNFIDSLDSKVNTNHTFLLEHYSTSSTTTSEIANKIDALKTTYIDPALNTKATVTAVEQVQTNISRIDGELVTVGSKLDGVIAESGKNKQDIAAVWTDMQVRVEAESALSTRIDNVVATTYDHDARIVAETKARTDADSAMASDISAINARVGTTEGKITSLEEVTTTTNSSLSQVSTKLDNLVTTVDGKASSQALNDVSSRVSNAEGTLTSQGQSITKLTNDLDTTNNTVNTKASADSVSALTNRVSETEGKVTSNSNALTTLTNRVTTTEGEITKKADATVLNNYYTKTEANEATAGHISSFASSLSVGGRNLILNSKSLKGIQSYGLIEDNVFKTVSNGAEQYIIFTSAEPLDAGEYCFSVLIKASNLTIGAMLPINLGGWGNYIELGSKDTNGEWVKIHTTFTVAAKRTVQVAIDNYYGTTGTLDFKLPMLERGTIPSDWSPAPEDIDAGIASNANAISGLTTRVTSAEDNITSQGTSITNLQNSVSTVNNSLSTKADSSALSTLDNKVTSIDGRTTTNTNSITSLQGSVDTINGTLITKADSSALNNYYTKNDADSAIAGKITEFKTNYVLPELGKKFDASAINAYYNKSDTESAITSKIDSFKANYVDTELGKKFNASAISDYYTKAQADSAISSATTGVSSTFDNKLKDTVTIKDTRNDNQLPEWYWANYPRQRVTEFKFGSAINAPYTWYGNLTTTVHWSDASGGAIQQIFTSEDSLNTYTRYSVDGSNWSNWKSDIKDLTAVVNNKVDASVLNTYYTKAQADEAIASQTSDIRTTVGNHTTSIQQHSESINGIKANWTLRLNANGRISGMTLMNDGRTSEFAIEADNFYVGAIDSAYKPFQVKTVGWTGVDGRSYPSGVYINNAVIGDLDAKVIRAGTIIGDKIKAGSITGDKIEAGSITADRIQIGSLGRDRLDSSLGNKVDTAYSTANSANNKIDNLSIGGRNFLKETGSLSVLAAQKGGTISNGIFSTVSNGTEQYIILVTYEPLLAGDYCLSAYVKSSGLDKGVMLPFSINGGWRYQFLEPKNSNGEWVRVFIKFTLTSTTTVQIALDNYSNTTGTLNFKLPKLEKGNLVTDWIPAPEDVQNSITTVDNKVKDIFDDNKITPDEKQTLLVTYKQIANDNDIWRNQAALIGLDYTRQYNAHATLLSASRPYLAWVCRSDALNQTDTLNAGERTTLMNAIAEYHAANQDLAQRVGSNLRTTGQGALQQVTDLKNEINNDNILTPPEKAYLYDRWLEIIRTNEWFNNQFPTLEIPWAEKIGNNYDDWYNKVQAIISDCVSGNLNASTTLTGNYSGGYIRDIFYNYYYYENRLKARIQDFQKQRADNAYNLANSANGVAAGARDLLNRWKANGNGTLYIDDNHIAVNKIGANEIAAGAINADHIYGGSITGDKIKSNTEITAPKISGGEININNNFVVKPDGTVTIRSATSGGRLEIKSNLIQVFDANGTLRVRLGVW